MSKIKQADMFDKFQSVVTSAKEVQKEWERLASIEERVESDLNTIKQEITGLERAVGMSSITGEAKYVINNTLEQKKIAANILGKYLGIGEQYTIIRR